ncbi:MAG: FAD-binding protein [Candidatus Paceibacteria bacterium]
MDSIYQKINKYGKVRCDEMMKRHLTIQAGGPVKYLVFVDDREDLISLLRELDSSGIEYFVLGHGGNTLISESGFEGVGIINKTEDKKVEGNKLHVDSGLDITKASQHAMFNNLSGFEWGVGAVGSVGGNIYHNEKVKDKRFELVLSEVEAYKDGEVFSYSCKNCEFGVDESVFHAPGMIITRAVFKLKDETADSEQSMEYINHKNKNLPNFQPSVGPVFRHLKMDDLDLGWFDEGKQEKIKNHGEAKPKWLFDQMDLEACDYGVSFYENNPNFIINEDNASADAIIKTIEKMEHKVYDKYGVELKRKVHTLGF